MSLIEIQLHHFHASFPTIPDTLPQTPAMSPYSQVKRTFLFIIVTHVFCEYMHIDICEYI